MEHLQHYEQEGGEGDDTQPRSQQPRGPAPLPYQAPGNTRPGWDPQDPGAYGPSYSVPLSIQTDEQFPNPQDGSPASGYGPGYTTVYSPPQGNLSPTPQYGSNHPMGNYDYQDRAFPYRQPPHPNQQSMQWTNSLTTALTNTTLNSHGSNRSRLDPDYVMMGSAYFIPGTVFACLWTEPLGGTTAHNHQHSPRISKVCFGQYAYSNILRFVVMLTPRGQQFSLCCPIKTYGHKGTGKNPNTHSQHSMIYTTGRPPERIRGEKEFVKVAIEVEPADIRDPLDPRSRLNFAKPTPVEHNLLVKRLGKVIPGHLQDLFRSYDEENGTKKIRRAENAAIGEVGRREAEQPRGDDGYDDEDEDSAEGRDESRRMYDDEKAEDDYSPESRRVSGRRPSASSRNTRAEHPLVESSSYTQTHRGRSNTGLTSRSSPVPFGSQREIGRSPRRMTQPQIEAVPAGSQAPNIQQRPSQTGRRTLW